MADALNLLGAALFTAGEDGTAVEPLREAVRLQPGHAAALTNLAIVLQHRQDWAAAERSLQNLLALSPDLGFAHGRLGSVVKERGDLARAARLLRRTVRLARPSALDWLNLGLIALLNGAFAEADGAFRRAIADTPDGALAHRQLGEVLLRLGRPEEAAKVLARALRVDPEAYGAGDGLARCRRYAAATAMARTEPAGPQPVRTGGFAMRGAFNSHSGYGHFCRRLIQRLRRDGVPLQAIGVLGPESWPEEDLDRPVPARAMVNCLIPLATEPVPGLATVTFSMFEGTRIPPAWQRQSMLSDLVLVPTESSRLAWEAQGFPAERLRVCPLGVDPEDATREDAPAPTLVDPNGRLVSSYRHRFLNISDFIPRKNIIGLLRVWLRSTAPSDDAVLILKLGKGGGDAAMRAALGELLRLAEADVGKRLAQAAPINLIDRAMDDAGMTGLYRAATHYWSLSHGEGWDLPMSKAGAMGLTLVAPRHSAYVDYLDDTNAHMIPAKVGPALLPGGGGYYPPFHSLDWWIPDEDAASDILKTIIRGNGAPKSARARLLERFTWERSAARLLAILDEAGLRG
ncbi:tetratricopeptide (TPR) repeat protein [Azospirillum picis]|uniref:Tetratricopeptide (TPR) repeat protein n=2 Tax=Azospirillum picis TaxID=488438 RepID=A0ABU0MSR6_9PROT|nr:tetratricopeptide (TPR) repeat protein [Azospirillum picis]MDQ0536492.1 tetratricopeptide (TPR) repeat protein [Azospirillum picis]